MLYPYICRSLCVVVFIGSSLVFPARAAWQLRAQAEQRYERTVSVLKDQALTIACTPLCHPITCFTQRVLKVSSPFSHNYGCPLVAQYMVQDSIALLKKDVECAWKDDAHQPSLADVQAALLICNAAYRRLCGKGSGQRAAYPPSLRNLAVTPAYVPLGLPIGW